MKHGFSLVELSIVLVILGLLTGGILAGQNLIRAAELRSVTSDLSRYSTAVFTFRDKYFALPGDMRNATQFWGSAGGDGDISGTCSSQTGTGTQTCNGNGDGNFTSSIGIAGGYTEFITFWQHLSNAGLIEGSYNGIAGSGGIAHVIIAENAPQARVSSGCYSVNQALTVTSGHAWFHGDYEKRLSFGALMNDSSGCHAPLIKAEEAWGIDTKLDDGLPGHGLVHANPLCTAYTGAVATQAANNRLTAEYDLLDSAANCSLGFEPGW